MEGQNSPFLKQLASSDVEQREKALETLRMYLMRTAPFDHLELMKLWKGLYYCMWMTANPLPQQRLAQDLSSLVDKTLARNNVLPFVDVFWETMAREWPEIDSHRLDKYLRLCRFMMRSTFAHLAHLDFADEAVAAHNEMLIKTPLSPNNKQVPDGMRYHVLDVYVDELEHVRGRLGDAKLTTDALLRLLLPIQHIHRETRSSTVRKRATETLSDERLQEWGVDVVPAKPKQADEDEDDEDEFQGFDA